MSKSIWVVIASLMLALVLTGCDQFLFGVSVLHSAGNTAAETTPEVAAESPGGSTSDDVSLVDNLRAAGAEVVSGDTLSQPFFDVTGQIIKVNGEDVQVFEFANETSAANAASQISPDGSSSGTTMITWIASPHFYRTDKVIVLYVGENEEIINLLESILGPQFAGR